MDKSIIGFIVFIAAFILGRVISEKALKSLNEEENKKLVAGFSTYRIFSLVGIVFLVIIYYGSQSLIPNSYIASLNVFVGVLVIYLLANTIYAYSKLKKLELPDNYINKFLLSTFVQYIGLFIFFGFRLSENP